MNSLQALKNGSSLLKEKNISTHIIDSELLLSKILNKTREEMLINLNEKINEKNKFIFKKYLLRRLKKEPIAYILEEKEFWSKKFFVNKNTLIPRPETELLVDKLLKIYSGKKLSILDIGTGCGCIIISLLSNLNQSRGYGIDISKKATFVAKMNVKKHKLSDCIKILNVSFENFFHKKFDLIVSNPPYIEKRKIKNLSDDIKKFEPRMALDGGNDGLDLIKKIIYKSNHILKVNGLLALEIGNEQVIKVSKKLKENNFRVKDYLRDYKDNIRCVIAIKNK